MNVYIAKDNYSFYILNLFNEGDQLSYDWSLNESYSILVSRGTVSINSKSRKAVGIFDIQPGIEITMNAETEAMTICSFLLDDDIMSELIPNASTLTQLRNSSSYLIETEEEPTGRMTPQLSFDGTISSPATFSLSDLNTKILEGLSL
jgi:hypothetical protein